MGVHMPFLIRPGKQNEHGVIQLLGAGDLTDGRITVDLHILDQGQQLVCESTVQSLLWVQILSGSVHLAGQQLSSDHVLMASGGATLELETLQETRLFYAQVPRAKEYDPTLAKSVVVHDWSREPVLNSEHDSRQRIYLASPKLWGTHAVKGEMIIYPSGASGAAHHHEGAEHFQYLMSGEGTAYLGGEACELQAGDLLYNFENEIHSFANHTSEPMIFVEFFVPGESETVWVEGANACGWQPTGLDIQGREPARELDYHIHGQGDV